MFLVILNANRLHQVKSLIHSQWMTTRPACRTSNQLRLSASAALALGVMAKWLHLKWEIKKFLSWTKKFLWKVNHRHLTITTRCTKTWWRRRRSTCSRFKKLKVLCMSKTIWWCRKPSNNQARNPHLPSYKPTNLNLCNPNNSSSWLLQ